MKAKANYLNLLKEPQLLIQQKNKIQHLTLKMYKPKDRNNF